MMRFIFALTFALLSSATAFAHVRLTAPKPRNNSDGLKAGPCGNVARTATPTTFMAGETITVQWEETINHPGKFIFSFSPANDLNFNQNVLATIVDIQDQRNNLPHKYQAQIKLPNQACEACTFQMIQSMEENPAAPTYYYSCADIRLVAAGTATPTPAPTATPVVPATPTPSNPGDGNSSQSSQSGTDNSLTQAVPSSKFGGCGVLKSLSDKNDPKGPGALFYLAFLTPFLTFMALRSRATAAMKRR